jgi:hypothetical protein
MTTTKIVVLALGTLLAACSGSGIHDAEAPRQVGGACEGGSIHGDAELARFAHCVTVHGDLEVTSVTTLAPLRALEAVDGTLAIRQTERLYTLEGLERLNRVEELSIEQNRSLISIGSLNALAHAARVSIVANPRLTSMHGFMNALSRSGSQITLVGNVGLRAEGVASTERVSVL